MMTPAEYVASLMNTTPAIYCASSIELTSVKAANDLISSYHRFLDMQEFKDHMQAESNNISGFPEYYCSDQPLLIGYTKLSNSPHTTLPEFNSALPILVTADMKVSYPEVVFWYELTNKDEVKPYLYYSKESSMIWDFLKDHLVDETMYEWIRFFEHYIQWCTVYFINSPDKPLISAEQSQCMVEYLTKSLGENFDKPENWHRVNQVVDKPSVLFKGSIDKLLVDIMKFNESKILEYYSDTLIMLAIEKQKYSTNLETA